MRDRFMRGAVAGLIGGIALTAVSLFFIAVLGFGSLRFFDIAGLIIYGRRPVSLPEILFAEFGHLVVSSGAGVLYAFLVKAVSSRYYIIKGVAVGIATWFSVYSITTLFRVPHLTRISLNSSLSNLISSVVFGVVMAATLGWLDKRYAVHH